MCWWVVRISEIAKQFIVISFSIAHTANLIFWIIEKIATEQNRPHDIVVILDMYILQKGLLMYLLPIMRIVKLKTTFVTPYTQSEDVTILKAARKLFPSIPFLPPFQYFWIHFPKLSYPFLELSVFLSCPSPSALTSSHFNELARM